MDNVLGKILLQSIFDSIGINISVDAFSINESIEKDELMEIRKVLDTIAIRLLKINITDIKIYNATAALTPSERISFTFSALYNFSDKDIAEIYGATENSITSYRSRAKTKLLGVLGNIA